MRRLAQVSRLLAGCLLAGACSEPTSNLQSVPDKPQLVIQDAVHNGGDGRLFFLPPLVENPANVGTGVPDAAPTVIICEWYDYCANVIAEYTRTTGPDSETIRANGGGEYTVNWHTRDAELIVGAVYRVFVVVDGTTLGHADVYIVNNRGSIRSEETGDLIPLVDGSTLPIKFRLVRLPGLTAKFVNTRLATTCAIVASGDAFCWGYDANGQVGAGTAAGTRSVATKVTGGHAWQFISASDNVCGLTTAGVVYCWGYGDGGHGDGTDASYAVPTAVAGGLTFAALAESRANMCGATADGTAYCWGYNIFGGLGTPTAPDGCNVGPCARTPYPVSGGLAFRSLSKGGATCGITFTDKLYCWGPNEDGQIGVGTTTNSFVPLAVEPGLSVRHVSANGFHTCALTTADQAYCWGSNGHGQLGDGTTTQRLTPVPVGGGLAFATISTSMTDGTAGHTCGVTTSGVGYCWGSNIVGQLGDGTNTGSHTPVPVAGGLTWRSISAGYMHSCGVTTSDEVYCWGWNARNELGNGSSQDSAIPVQVVRALN